MPEGRTVGTLMKPEAVLWIALASLVYYALLYVITSAMPFAPVPTFWRQAWPFDGSSVHSWLGLMDAVAAALAAIPVAALLTWRVRVSSRGVAVATGLLVAAYVFGGSVLEYGARADVMLVGAHQFLWIALALPAFTMLLARKRVVSQ